MKLPFPFRILAGMFFSCGVALLFHPSARAEDFVAVSSKVSNGYVRTKLSDGSFAPETYVFKEGGYLGSKVADDSIDKMTFASVASTIAGPLAKRNYVASVEPKAAKLLIVVYWGVSRAPAETSGATPMSQEMQRDSPASQPTDGRHQVISGYVPFRNEEGWSSVGAMKAQGSADKMVNEEDAMVLGYESAVDPDLRQYRYFVVLLAYDAQTLLRDRKKRLLWEARFSMGEHRNRFDQQLQAMVLEASAYFGRDSFGLKHDPVPEGHVEIGSVRSLETIADPDTSAVLAPDGAHVAYLAKGENGLELVIADIDQQEFHSAGDIPGAQGQPVQLAWLDAGRVGVKLSSSEVLAFNERGKRVDFDPRTIGLPFAGFSRAKADDASVGPVQALAEEKLPNRKVVILGWDQARHRCLLIASDRAAVGRYFVYDRANDLLYEVGRSVPAQ